MKLWIHNDSYLRLISALREGVLARISPAYPGYVRDGEELFVWIRS
jgi:hypothetical protein